MADNGDKTEKATPKRRKDARSEGQLCRSPDLSGALVLIVMFGGLKILGGSMVTGMEEIIVRFLSVVAKENEVTVAALFPLSIEVGLKALAIAAPIMAVSLVMGLATNYMQIGIVKLKEPFKMKFERINPVNGFKNMFSMRSAVNLLKSVIKLTVLIYILYGQLKKIVPEFPVLMTSDLEVSIKYMIDNIFSISFKLAMAYVFIGAFDYLYQRWDYEKSLRMSKEEIKEEFKQTEGDPKIKGKIKQKQQQMSMLRMMAEVANADVVITNPTHYAVALKYDEQQAGAPVVLAKGKDFVALKIKEKAKENYIKMIENKPLAQALYATVEIGQEIPPEFYAAVAEILAEIYRLKRK